MGPHLTVLEAGDLGLPLPVGLPSRFSDMLPFQQVLGGEGVSLESHASVTEKVQVWELRELNP